MSFEIDCNKINESGASVLADGLTQLLKRKNQFVIHHFYIEIEPFLSDLILSHLSKNNIELNSDFGFLNRIGGKRKKKCRIVS